MWVEMVVTGANGAPLYQSGKVDREGTIDPKAKIFHAKSVNAKGEHTYKPWEITRFEYNHTIPPKGSTSLEYTFLVPATENGPLTVRATLRYRSYPQTLVNLLLGKNTFTLPIVDMAQKEATVKVKK